MVLSTRRLSRSPLRPASAVRPLQPAASRSLSLSLSRSLSLSLSLLALGAGCKEQSLFDEAKDPDGPAVVGADCPANCLGDAARDFKSGNSGTGERWRYLEDRRDRSWTEMTPVGDRVAGADPATSIAACADTPTAPACVEIPGALLVSSAGSASASDPAIEFRAGSKGTVQVGLRAFVPDTAIAQQLLVYRNSREDLLFSAAAVPGELFERALFADLLSGDRLLVALAPNSGGAADVALELFVSDVGTASRCQVALPFEQVSGNAVTAQCGGEFTHYNYNDVGDDSELPPVLIDGPYPELGQAGRITLGKYFKGTELLDKGGDVTVQFWMRTDVVDPIYAGFPFSDLDLNDADPKLMGGLGVRVYDDGTGTTRMEASNCKVAIPNTVQYDEIRLLYPSLAAWHFVRAVHAGGTLSFCVNGKRAGSVPVPTGRTASSYVPYLGKNVVWPSQGAFFDGAIDDLRVLSTALPCE